MVNFYIFNALAQNLVIVPYNCCKRPKSLIYQKMAVFEQLNDQILVVSKMSLTVDTSLMLNFLDYKRTGSIHFAQRVLLGYP